MSYDVMVGSDWPNITSNLRQFFIDFEVYPPDMHEQTAEAVSALIKTALERIVDTDTLTLNRYNSDNGWGTWPHGVRFLMEVRDACRENQEEIVKVSW